MSTYRSSDNPPSGSSLSAGQPQSTSPTPGASAASVGAERGVQYPAIQGPRSSAGERLPCKQGVPGSSPGRSTKSLRLKEEHK